jgi:hypothetical protein
MSQVKKREYNPPTVLRIQLHSDEVLAVGCKTTTGNSPGFGGSACGLQLCNQQTGS